MRCVGFTDAAVTVDGAAVETAYDAEKNTLCFRMVTRRDGCAAAALGGTEIARDDWKGRTKRRMQRLQTSLDEKNAMWEALAGKDRNASLLGTLSRMCRTPDMMSCLEETMFGQDE